MQYSIMEAEFLMYKLPYIGSNMYLLIERDEALIIDPCPSEAALSRLKENGVRHVTVLLTHEHFDHTSGVNWFRKYFSCRLICQEECGARISIPANNRPLVVLSLMQASNGEETAEIKTFYESFPIEGIEADLTFHEDYDLWWQGHQLNLHSCPGHSPGSIVICFDDTYAFTGDYMIPDIPVILRYPGGSEAAYRQRSLPYLLSLQGNMMIMPGHGTPCLLHDLCLEKGVFRLKRYRKREREELFSLDKTPEAVAFYTESGTWSYGRLSETSARIADALGGRILVFILCTNTSASIAGYVACMNHNIVPALLDGNMDGELLEKLIEVYHPSFLWLPLERSQEFTSCQEILSIDGYVLLDRRERNPYVLHPDLALLMTTSGSTGSPKFVRLSYENLRINTESIIEYLSIDAGERSITNLPMHYVYGLSIINTHLYVGASLVVTDKTLFQKEFWQLFKEKKVTNFGGVPYTFEMLKRLRFFRMDLPNLATITQAGGKLDIELHEKFAAYAKEQGKKFFVMYGAAEATARMGYLPAEYSLEKVGSMGIAIPGGCFELMGEAGAVIDDASTPGELVYHGANVMMGYAEAGNDLVKGNEMGGRLLTGDIAIRDEEGFYTIIGRKKRFIKMFGKRVNLQETEHILSHYLEGVEIVCSGWDDHMYIFISGEVKVDGIVSYISKKMGIHPSAFSVVLLDEIPKNDAGKVLYYKLEKYYDL